MNKSCIIFCVFLILISSICFSFANSDAGYKSSGYKSVDYLRIHIRANSNSENDQAVKYMIKDAVVDFLTPKLAFVEDKGSALKTVQDNLKGISYVCERELFKNGFYYGATATLKKEKFPTRSYGELTLPSGEYDALIVSLGDGAGDNWWCVVYPPLCFTNSENVVYKSKILELIERFKIKE